MLHGFFIFHEVAMIYSRSFPQDNSTKERFWIQHWSNGTATSNSNKDINWSAYVISKGPYLHVEIQKIQKITKEPPQNSWPFLPYIWNTGRSLNTCNSHPQPPQHFFSSVSLIRVAEHKNIITGAIKLLLIQVIPLKMKLHAAKIKRTKIKSMQKEQWSSLAMKYFIISRIEISMS